VVSRNVQYLDGNVGRIGFAFKQAVRTFFEYGNRNWRSVFAKQFNEGEAAT